MTVSKPPRMALVASFSGTGGVEGNIFKLLPALLEAGVGLDLLGIFKMPVPDALKLEHPDYRLIDLGVTHSTLVAPVLMRYFKANPTVPVLVAKDRAIRMAIVARALSGSQNRLVGQLNTHLSAALSGKPALQRWWRTWPMRRFYRHIDAVVNVSSGVAEDTHRLTGLPMNRLPVIRNPVINAELFEKSHEPVDHPWFGNQHPTVILGAGRLTQQKDFPTLIRAFALVRQQRDCRLVILGNGPDQRKLEALASELNLREQIDFTGHVDNPYAYMVRANVFALSSRWEGSGNVLTEAMALGVPVVSTDCPSGPAEMLEQGRFGRLVGVGDPVALAEAISHTLDQPLPADQLKAAVEGYRVEQSAQHYIEVMGLADRICR